MSTDSSRRLLVHLREMDEHYARLEPTRGAESRLIARMERRGSPQRSLIGLAWKTSWRPIVFIGACAAVLALSLHDDVPVALRGHFRPLHPSVPAASTDVRIPTPKVPRKTNPTFHDAVAPTLPTSPTNERPINELPFPTYLPEVPAQSEDSFTPPPTDGKRRIQSPFRLGPFDKPTTTSFDHLLSDVYLSAAPESQSESAPRSWGPASRAAKNPTATQQDPTESNASVACQSAESFKKSADFDCSEKGFALAELTLLEPCGNGQFRGETHECAETELDACYTDTIGDGTTCFDPGQIKTLAYETCLAAGQQLTDLVYDMNDCGGKTKMATFTCCTPAPQQPPSDLPSCYEMTPADASTCKDYGALKQDGSDLCALKSAYLFDMKFEGNCPDGQDSIAVVVCCGP